MNRRRFFSLSAASLITVAGCLNLSGNEGPVEIEDWYDLDAVREDLDNNYVLGSDLDDGAAGYDECVNDPNDGWNPIGELHTEFSGTFDGQGYTISNLRCERSETTDVGVFGASTGTIQNISLSDADIAGDERVGGVVGLGDGGELSNISVSESTITGEIQVGGVVGWNNRSELSESAVRESEIRGESRVGGLVGNGSRIGTSSVREAVVTGDDQIGGLVGFNVGELPKSYANATVTGDNRIGGLVGANGGKIMESYATGEVIGEERVGGLAGFNYESTTFEGSISESYTLGKVEGLRRVGGLVGANSSEVDESWSACNVTGEEATGGLIGLQNEDGELSAGYWDTDATGQANAIGDGEGDVTGLETEQMLGAAAVENMAGLDFDETWIDQTDPEDYPTFTWLSETD